jgi:large subunit ribosomal protein L4
MVTLEAVNIEGATQDGVGGNEVIFNAAANEALVHTVAVALRNAQHQGTHKVKNRAEVQGSGAKPFRQKGTGRARQGSIREPHMRGGGSVFGPRPRSYRQRVTARVKRQALCLVLSERVRGGRLCVLKGLQVAAPKTKPFAKMIDAVAPEGRKTLLVTRETDDNVVKSSRNIPRITVRTAAEVNALDVLNAVRVVIQEEALAPLEERLT